MSAAPGVAPPCPGPDPDVRPPRRLVVPPDAVDCHAHVVGGPPRHRLIPAAQYTPPEATASQYLGMLDALGVSRGVLVQISVHGTDNGLMLEALRAHPHRLRGVAVVAPDIPARELRTLAESGVRGLRINALSGGGPGLADIDRYGAICREMGWHLQLFLDCADLPPLAGRLAAQRVALVFDHVARRPPGAPASDPGVATLLALLRDGAWAKLSGAYRFGRAGPPWADTVPVAREIAAIAPDRCVWGSDWPNVGLVPPVPNVTDLLDLLADWVPDASARQRILVDNPARLYGFP